MRIIITGIIALVIWSFISMWLYVDVLKPATRKQVVSQVTGDSQTREADSLAKLYASMPETLYFHFEFDNAKLAPEQGTDGRIDELRAWLDKYPGSVIQVTGHTDFIGTPEYNHDLGLVRARVVKEYLETKGIPSSRIEAISRGEDDPVSDLFTTEGRRLNRRTEVSIKK